MLPGCRLPWRWRCTFFGLGRAVRAQPVGHQHIRGALDLHHVLFGSWKVWVEKAGVRYGDIKSFRVTREAAGFV